MYGQDKMRRLLDARRRAREQEARDALAFAARTQAEKDEQIAKNAAAAADERRLQARISANNEQKWTPPTPLRRLIDACYDENDNPIFQKGEP